MGLLQSLGAVLKVQSTLDGGGGGGGDGVGVAGRLHPGAERRKKSFLMFNSLRRSPGSELEREIIYY